MDEYNPLKLFKQRDEINPTAAGAEQNQDKPINVKLKQFYNLKEKLESFYSAGKISVLSPCHFACQFGSTVKVITTPSTVKKADDPVSSGIDSGFEEEHASSSIKAMPFRVFATYGIHMDEIISFDACPITSTLITAHKSKLLRKWDIQTQEIVQVVKSFHSIPISMVEIDQGRSALMNEKSAFDPTMTSEEKIQTEGRKQLAWATVAGSCVKVWDDGGSTVSKNIIIPNIPSVGFVKWKPSINNSISNELTVAERNIYIIGFDKGMKNYQILQTLEGHYSQVTGIEWLDTGKMISAGRDKVLILWNSVKDGQYQKHQSFVIPGSIEATYLMSGVDLYLMISSPNCIRHFNTENNQLSSVDALCWTENEAITGCYTPLTHRDQLDEAYITTHTGEIYRVGRKMLKSKKKKQAELGNRAFLQVNQQFVGHLDEIYSAAIWEQNSETKIAVANNTTVIKVYAMNFGNCQFLKGHKNIVVSLATFEDWLASSSKDHNILLWRSNSTEPLFTLEGHLSSVNSVHLSSKSTVTGPIVYSVAEDNFLRAWNTGKCTRSTIAHDRDINVVHCSPNGELLVTGSRDKTAKIWNSESLELVGTLKGHKKTVWDAKFSFWDQLIVTSSADCTLKIWNLLSMECIKTLQGHDGAVLSGLFINSGLQVLSSSSDGTWKVWDIRTPLCVLTSESSEEGQVWALSSTLDGSLVVTGTTDSVLSLWEDVTRQKADEKIAKQKKILEDEQELNNVIRRSDWNRAIRLAIELDRPFTLLKVVREIQAVENLSPIIQNLSIENKSQLITFITKWNTNTRTSTEGQILLKIILESSKPSELRNLPLSSLISYTEKHFQRLEKHEQLIALLEHFANPDGEPNIVEEMNVSQSDSELDQSSDELMELNDNKQSFNMDTLEIKEEIDE